MRQVSAQHLQPSFQERPVQNAPIKKSDYNFLDIWSVERCNKSGLSVSCFCFFIECDQDLAKCLEPILSPLLNVCAAHIWSLSNKPDQRWEMWVTRASETQPPAAIRHQCYIMSSITEMMAGWQGHLSHLSKELSMKLLNKSFFKMNYIKYKADVYISLSLLTLLCAKDPFPYSFHSFVRPSIPSLILDLSPHWTIRTFFGDWAECPHFSPTYT